MRFTWMTMTAFAALLIVRPTAATEPNETFESATLLSPGVVTVSDELRQAPDTLLGVRNFLGQIDPNYVNDDDTEGDNPVGNDRASILTGVPTANGTIEFAVTGFGDDGFLGSHNQSGRYEVFVQTYDDLGPANQYNFPRTMQPGVVNEFSFFDEDALFGTYDVFIDNLIDYEVFADIDFYTFTGLTPNATFTAETLDPSASGVDTLLGWFAHGGDFLKDDDNGGVGGRLSLLSGTVPASGQVTLAVTGTEDLEFDGTHQALGAYDLKLTLGGGGFAADFNNDGKVNGLDLATWKTAFGATPLGDADDDNDTDGADLLIWQRQFGSGVAIAASATAVPEPATAMLMLAAALVGTTAFGRLRQPPR